MSAEKTKRVFVAASGCMDICRTRAWKEETEKMPSRPMASLVGRDAKPSRRLGLGGSPPCRLAR